MLKKDGLTTVIQLTTNKTHHQRTWIILQLRNIDTNIMFTLSYNVSDTSFLLMDNIQWLGTVSWSQCVVIHYTQCKIKSILVESCVKHIITILSQLVSNIRKL